MGLTTALSRQLPLAVPCSRPRWPALPEARWPRHSVEPVAGLFGGGYGDRERLTWELHIAADAEVGVGE